MRIPKRHLVACMAKTHYASDDMQRAAILAASMYLGFDTDDMQQKARELVEVRPMREQREDALLIDGVEAKYKRSAYQHSYTGGCLCHAWFSRSYQLHSWCALFPSVVHRVVKITMGYRTTLAFDACENQEVGYKNRDK